MDPHPIENLALSLTRISPASQPEIEAGPSPSNAAPLIYEQLLERDPRWALNDAGRHFDEKSSVFAALHKIAKRLSELNISYAVGGGIALFRHGLRRFTEDVDVLVTSSDLKRIHDELEGLGYLPPHKHSKHLRDTELGVRIEFLTTGGYPGDGKPKPVAFPDPRDVSFDADGIKYIQLPNLVELKLASGMSHPGRLKDLADVLELIKVLNLPVDFAEQLNPYVREKYTELWGHANQRFEIAEESEFWGVEPGSANEDEGPSAIQD